jgi:DNA-binding NtrC family response regulator
MRLVLLKVTSMDRRYSVLIADQNARCRDELRNMLEPEGYDVVPAESGREAIERVHAEEIHVLVMEVQLPDYTGFEIYHAIKHIRRTLPCIFTALRLTESSIRDALGEGAVSIFPKPLEVPRLVRAVDRSINRFYSRSTEER